MHGLVIGKFDPPHKGHRLLIETALAQSDRVTIVVCRHPDHFISGELRQAWLQEMHPEARVTTLDMTGFDTSSSAAWTAATLAVLDSPIDLMFTSEQYGDRYAPLLGAKHILVDLPRTQVPTSSRQIRLNPQDHWEYLEEPVKEYFTKLSREHRK